jgi:putative tryptophan/tyrosine transport system substrate-binding protein
LAKRSLQSGLVLRLASAALAAGLAACSVLPGPLPGAEEPELPEVPGSSAGSGLPAPAAGITRMPARGVELPPPPSVVAVVISARQPAFDSVADELVRRLDGVRIYDLSDTSVTPEQTFRQIGDSNAAAIVAIGMTAARSAVALASVPVVFCQVFNYQEHRLVTGASRGVAALAPLDAHLSAWKKANPSLKRVGAILGSGHEELVLEAQVAAERYGVELSLAIVESDQEAQYAFRRMVSEIDGFWLFPDNRILSSRSLKEMLALAARRQVEVAVSSESLLALGARLSVSAVPADIAATVIEVLRRIEAGQLAALPPISPLSSAQVVTR